MGVFSEKNEDQKSYVNPPAPPSEAYQTFVSPIAHDARGGQFCATLSCSKVDMKSRDFRVRYVDLKD